MTLGKRTLFSLLLGAVFLVNVLDLTHIKFLSIGTVVSFFVCILLPGLLISFILRVKRLSMWENALFIVGLSIAFWEFGGLLLNILLPLLGIKDPLAFHNLIIGFDVYMVLLFCFAWLRTKGLVIHLQPLKFSRIEKLLYILPILFPIFAALGAIILNNGGSNSVTLILLGIMGLYILLLLLYHKRISSNLYPYSLFFIGLACLFTTSLRSWYITGHDIEKEMYVFQLANTRHFWEMPIFQDPYNACLSITILPTVFANLFSLQDIYVYKVIFQVLFATTPVIVYFIVKRYTSPILAFLSAIFFLSFPLFFTDMPMINRQEIGFIFFGLAVHMMLPSKLPTLNRKTLFLIFGCAEVVSHYSTYYILLGLLVFVYVLTRLNTLSFAKGVFASLLKKTHITSKRRFNANAFLTLPLIIIVFAAGYVWINLYTRALNGFAGALHEIVSGDELKASDITYYLFPKKVDPTEQLHIYIKQVKDAEKVNSNQFYSQTITSKYTMSPLPQELLGPTPLGKLLLTLHIPLFKNQEDFGSFPAVFIQVIMLIIVFALFSFQRVRKKIIEKVMPFVSLPKIGLASIDKQPTMRMPIAGERQVGLASIDKLPTARMPVAGERQVGVAAIEEQPTVRRHKLVWPLPYSSSDSNNWDDASSFGAYTPFAESEKPFDLQFLFLCVSSIFLLFLLVALPNISALFGVLRMCQQFLFMLSLSVVLGIYFALFFINEQKRVLVVGIIILIFFLNFTGFIPHLTGNYYAQINLDNAGLYYDMYYVHDSDILASNWLVQHHIIPEVLETDAPGINKLQPDGYESESDDIFPEVIQKGDYVYIRNSRTVVVFVDGKPQIISSPKPFLDDNKNLIYSNGDNDIYK